MAMIQELRAQIAELRDQNASMARNELSLESYGRTSSQMAKRLMDSI